MGTNYPQIKAGDPLKFSARRENDISRALNQMNGFTFDSKKAGAGSGMRVRVYNADTVELTAGQAVVFDASKPLSDNAVPVKRFTNGAVNWGVISQTVNPKAYTSVIVTGPVLIEYSGEDEFVSPQPDGTFAAGGVVPVVGRSEGKAIILLGANSGRIALLELTSVPAQGYGNGEARQIVGYTDTGAKIYAPQIIPVRIPKL